MIITAAFILLRLSITAYVFRFIDVLKGRNVDSEGLVVTAQEVWMAEKIWIQTVQQGSFERDS